MKLKRIIRKVREFDYSDILKIICFLGFIVILIISASGCATLTDKEMSELQNLEVTDEEGVTKSMIKIYTDPIWKESKDFVLENKQMEFIDLNKLEELINK